MATDPRLPDAVIEAAIAASGEIERTYPHGPRDLRTDVSSMLMAAWEQWIYPAPLPVG